MTRHRLWVLLGAALLITACAKPGPGSGKAPAPAAKPAAQTAPAARNQKAATEADKPLTLTRLNEDGSETVEETTGDSGARNPLLAAVASTVAAATSSSAASAASGSWPEGSYTKIVPAQPTDVPTGQVEVLEFFWYACPHCYALEPTIVAWNKTKAAYITFARVPVLWEDGHRALARLYYTLVAMDKQDQVHQDIFKEIQSNNDPLISSGDPSNAAAAERMQLAFIRKLGLSDADFERNYHSLGVDTAMQRADQLVQRYRITAVPTFVVNGKYVADVSTAGTPERLVALINDLAAQEHKH
ncbi:MAG TPA: thiol:disulfide interchange protein DsbA/DsbL [Steroidobacteraceae bacterium]|jgi:thiol:disulfide interchange protein DsbA